MKRLVHKFRLYLAGIALLVGGSFAWASTAGLNVWAEKLQSLLDGNNTRVLAFADQESEEQGGHYEYVINTNAPLITDASQLSSPYSDPSEGQNIGNLIDGSISTFWHSTWHDGTVATGTHYFQVEMSEDAANVSHVAFQFTRRNSANDHSTAWSIYGTNDSNAGKDDCELLASIKTPFTEQGETISTEGFPTKNYKFLRFYSDAQDGTSGLGSRGYFHLAEFQLYGTTEQWVEDTKAPLEEGEYYFKAEYDADGDGVSETYFLGAANNWGTRAALIPNSVLWNLENVDGNVYHLDSYQSNGGDMHYLGSNAYVDAAVCDIYLTKDEQDGTYTLSLQEGSNYLSVAEIGFHKLPALGWDGDASKAIKFTVVSSEAEIQPGDNVTFLIRNANFDFNNRWGGYLSSSGNNQLRDKEPAWTIEASNKELHGGVAPNICAESWHSSFNLYQTLTNMPNGVYEMTVQAAVRDDAGRWDGVDYPVAYINDATATFIEMEDSNYVDYVVYRYGGETYTSSFNPSVNGSAHMADFSQMFAEGKYKVSIPVLVTNNRIRLGVKGTRTDMWAMFDNFTLTYYGYNAAAGSLYLNMVLQSSTFEEIGTCNAEVKTAYETVYTASETMAQAGTATYEECVEQGNKLTAAYNALAENIAAYKSAPEIINGLTAQMETVRALQKEGLTDEATAFIRNLDNGYNQCILTTEDITSAKQNFKAIISAALTTSMEAGDDLTLLITNPTFDTNGEGWNLEGYAQVNYNYGTAEVYHNAFDYYQVIPSAAAGIYRLSCTAFNRVDGSVRTAKLYGGISEEYLKLITEEGSAYALLSDAQETGADGTMFDSSSGTWPYDSKVTNVSGAEGQIRFTPYSMEGANIYFSTINPATGQPYYTISTQIVMPKQGDLRIGIKSESSSEWTIWDNFKLEYVGNNDDLMSDYTTQLKSYLDNDIYYNATLRQEATTVAASAEAGNLSEEEAYTIIGRMGNLIDDIKISVDAYAVLSKAITTAEERLTTTPNIDPEIAAELQTRLATAKEAYSTGSYSNDEAKTTATEITTLSRRLQSGFLIIELEKAGTLGDLVLDFVENFSDVKGITVTGPMNSDDMANIARMTSLTNLDLTNAQLTSIANSQFSNNDVLEVVRLPKTLTSLGGYAFNDCDALKSVTIAGNISSNNMGSYIFSSCDNLEEVIIKEGITTISYDMFQNCYRLSKLTLPLSLTTIREYAFQNCYSLANIPLPGKLQTIGYDAFYRDSSDGYVYNYQGYYYDENGYYHGIYDTIPNLSPKYLEIPASVTSIGEYAFYNMSGLESVTLNEGLTSLGSNAFYGTKVTTATFPSTLTTVGSQVFNSGAHYTSLSLTPPTANNGCPVAQPDTLHVPQLVVKAYKQASGWDKFKIVGTDEMPGNIVVRKQMNLDFANATLPEGYKPNITLQHTNVSVSSTNRPTTLGALEIHNGGTFSAGLLSMGYNHAQNNYYRYREYNYGYDYGQYGYAQYTTLITDGTMRADNIDLTMALTDGYWNFICVPFDVRVGDITCETSGTSWVIRRYDGEARAAVNLNSTWVNMTADDILEAGKGYIMHCMYEQSMSTYRVFHFPALNTVNKNLIFSAANRTLELAEYQSEYAHNRSWNLIGNPYPAYIEIGSTDFEAPITVWNGYNGYNAYSPLDDDYVLTPGEAFFVQRPLNKSSITFKADGRKSYYDVTGSTNNVKAIRQETSDRRVFNLLLSDGEHSDRTRVVINPAAAMDYEAERDAAKFPAMDATATQLYSVAAGVQYAINERPIADGSVQLAARFGKTGTYTFTLQTKAAESVILIDELEGTAVELNGTEGYTFNAEAGTADKRFRLQIAGTADAINQLAADDLRGADVFTLDGKKLAGKPAVSGVYLLKKNGIVRKVSVK